MASAPKNPAEPAATLHAQYESRRITVEPLPRVTVAIPVYNGANYLRDAISSCLEQSYPNLEVIVVNDGSDDRGETEAIAMQFTPSIIYLKKKNGGVASALNLALEVGSGEYFCWLSHDDIYLSSKVEKQIDYILHSGSDACVVYCRHQSIDANARHLENPPVPPVFDPHTASIQLILGQWLHCCTVLAPTNLFHQMGGFREDLPTTQDYDILVKMGLKVPFFEVPEILLLARQHSEQGSRTLSHRREIETFFREHIPMLSREYIQRVLTPTESLDTFSELGRQMVIREMPECVALVCRQLIECELDRCETRVILEKLDQIISMADAPDSEALTDRMKLRIRTILPVSILNKFSAFRQRVRRLTASIPNALMPTSTSPPATAKLDFHAIFKNNEFLGTESRSGGGSSLFQTRIIREEIPRLLHNLGIKTILDAPCGDWNWMQHVDLGNFQYIGGDIVGEIIQANQDRFGSTNVRFQTTDIIGGPIPKVDLILCRDCLVHLSNADALRALESFRRSGAQWLLTTTFTGRTENPDLLIGHIWRPLNLELEPFLLGKSEMIISEGCTEGNNEYKDKSLALWRLNPE